MKKLPNISTKTGDKGFTRLFSGETVSKTNQAIVANAKIDTFDRAMGRVYHYLSNYNILHCEIIDSLKKIQSRLIYLKGEIATDPNKQADYRKNQKAITAVDVDYLDKCGKKIKEVLEGQNYDIMGWVLYGEEGLISAEFDFLAGLCREAEIEVLRYSQSVSDIYQINPHIVKYINRLSDYLYWLARVTRDTSIND